MADPAAGGLPVVTLERPEQLDRDVVLALATRRCRVALDGELRARLAARRSSVLADLGSGAPVYGVSTGMGALAGVTLDEEAQARHQGTLVVGRSVGGPPWLGRAEARAVLAVRLRSFLLPEPGVSPELCQHLVDVLDADVLPAVPVRDVGTAGEVVPLAHLGGALLGTGQVLAEDGAAVPAGPALAAAGLAPHTAGAKEGVALLEGVPTATALAVLRAHEARALVVQSTAALAGSLAVVRASDDPLHPALGRGDAELTGVLAAVRSLRSGGRAGALQAPTSFRVTPPALAVLQRAAGEVDAAAERALVGVTDSPAHLDGRFVGTAGFAGTDLAAGLGALTVALVHAADLSAARLHRTLDARLTGLPPQLSDAPGVHAGMVAVHKRAVGVVHRLRRAAAPALVGPVETSLGQEDVQSFALEAACCADEAVRGLRLVLACELLAVHQARQLRRGPLGRGAAEQADDGVRPPLAELLDQVAAVLPAGTGDRPFGLDVAALEALLASGWAVPGDGVGGDGVGGDGVGGHGVGGGG